MKEMRSLCSLQSQADSAMTVRVQTEDFDVGQEMLRLRQTNPKVGAVASFVGVVRDLNDGDDVSSLTLEHYPGMTERSLEEIVSQAKGRWDIYDALIIHRVGTLLPLDQIVLVLVTGAHRGESFKACEFLMDYLKTRAPFWKKEQTSSGDRWVEARESDKSAAMRWENTRDD